MFLHLPHLRVMWRALETVADRAQTGLNGTRTNLWRQSQAPVCFNRGSKTHPGLRPWGWGSTTQMQGALTCRQFPGAGSGCPACARTRPADRRPGSRHRAAGGCPKEGLGRKGNPAPLRQRTSPRETDGLPQQRRSTVVSSRPPSSPRSRRATLTCQHAGEEHGREVVVEVENPSHQEEGEVMHHPAE